MNSHYIVRYGSEYPHTLGAVGKYASEYRAEVAAVNVLGTYMNDGDVIGYTQIIKINQTGETVVAHFEF